MDDGTTKLPRNLQCLPSGINIKDVPYAFRNKVIIILYDKNTIKNGVESKEKKPFFILHVPLLLILLFIYLFCLVGSRGERLIGMSKQLTLSPSHI